MTTRADIEDRVKRYFHRTDFTAADFDYAFAVATEAIGETLRSSANESTYPIAAASPSAPFTMPTEVREVERVEYQQPGAGWRILSSPNDWEVIGGKMRFRWTITGTIQMIAYIAPAAILPAIPTSTNAVMTAYPDVYMWRVAAECAAITQDSDMVNACLQFFGGIVGEINNRTRAGRIAAPAMIGA